MWMLATNRQIAIPNSDIPGGAPYSAIVRFRIAADSEPPRNREAISFEEGAPRLFLLFGTNDDVHHASLESRPAFYIA